MLGKFFLYDDYVYRAPISTEQLPESDLCEIVVYKDSMDMGLSPFEVTHLMESQVKILECLDPPASRLSNVLTEENMLSVGLFKPTGMKFNLASVLGSVPLATDDKGPSSPGQAKRRKTATKAKRVAGDKNALVSAGGATEDDHIDLTRGADPMHMDDDHTAGDSPVPDLRFPPAHARRYMEVMRSYVISHMSECISRRKIEDIEKVLAIYNRKVLNLEDSLVKACKCMVTNLEVVENEKSKEIHHLKKKNSSLRKSCDASEARVKEREEEIDNLRSALARAQHDAVENYKASSEYQQDLYAYGAESMSVSISLTKEWILTEHPSINPHGFDRFLARRRDLEQAAEQDGADDHADDPLQGEEGASQLALI
ncbi:Uncharacterized protein Adt_41020 [Abeliophyllum distichum]|uniref:Uncharacterized protein n=1 Tax=Abeliophyllum distichum TaxID=126358 RepID=A0ABD1PMN2_9LAMI